MPMRYNTITACISVSIALITWCVVGFFAWTINTDQIQRLETLSDAQRATIIGASSIRTHALALDTAPQRAELKKLLDVDVVEAANTIESVGKAAGVSLKLGDALPETRPVSEGVTLKAVGFVVEADGKFSALMRAATLLENLSLPSSITRLNIERAPKTSDSAPGLWHMSVYIRVLTTSDISS